jgi:anti-sigma regulatory factor (Ser/Thr protein kinase)
MLQLFGMEPQRRHMIRESSAIGEARRDAQRLAVKLGLDETQAGRAGVIVSELATNVFRHAGCGELLLQSIPGAQRSGIEFIAIDRGPGMDNPADCLRDGFSTGGTAGTGLGAVKRLSTEFDVYSVRGRGTVVMARIGPSDMGRFGAVCIPIEGESDCGDTWRLARQGESTALLLLDGLGHGTPAAQAAQRGAQVFQEAPFDEPAALIERIHHRLNGTRGAAGACAHVVGSSPLSYAGIGNIAGHLVGTESTRGLVSHSGTLGFQTRRVQQFSYPSLGPAFLIMHSDGLSARWDLADHAGLSQHHPAVMAAVLYRDHARGRDDATIVVVGAQ